VDIIGKVGFEPTKALRHRILSPAYLTTLALTMRVAGIEPARHLAMDFGSTVVTAGLYSRIDLLFISIDTFFISIEMGEVRFELTNVYTMGV